MTLDTSVNKQITVTWLKPPHIYGPAAMYTVSTFIFLIEAQPGSFGKDVLDIHILE